MLQKRGYDVKTFAYPLGEWNDEIVNLLKDSDYIAARDISKDNSWRDKRALTASMDSDFVWHMNYYKPEQKGIQEIEKDMAYNTWWQFEEGYFVADGKEDNIKVRSSINPTITTYAVIVLSKSGDKITNKFLVSREADYIIDIFGATSNTGKGGYYSEIDNINIYIDGVLREKTRGDGSSCVNSGNQYWCDYFVQARLAEGPHTITIEAVESNVRVDKFRVFRELISQSSYEVIITEFKNGSNKAIHSNSPEVVFKDDFNNSEIIEESGSMDDSQNPFWWLNSGAFFIKENSLGKTPFGALEKDSKWQIRYRDSDEDILEETDGGYYPQNIFRLITKSKWMDFRQSVYFNMDKYNLSDAKQRNESNGLLLFNRYQDSDNLYYAGVRVDGQAVVKKKINGEYYTVGITPVFGGEYDQESSPNLLPENTWFGLESEIKTINGDEVKIKLSIDKESNGVWQVILDVIDDGKSYGGPAILNEGYAGIRTDFMDVEFDNYRIEDIGESH